MRSFWLMAAKAVAVVLADTLWKARLERREQKLRHIRDDHLGDVCEPQQAVFHEDRFFAHLKFGNNELFEDVWQSAYQARAE